MRPKSNGLAPGCFPGIIFALILAIPILTSAQENGNRQTEHLSLDDVLKLAKDRNTLVKAMESEQQAATADWQDAKANALPNISASSNYQRFTKLTLYNDGLSKSVSVPKIPSQDAADLGMAASFNLYSGGRQKAYNAEQFFRKDLAGLNTMEQTAYVRLQAVNQYLEMVKLTDQRRYLEEQLVRAETRQKNINSLYVNQKVTRSDLLRAELNVSAVKLNLTQVQNDIQISNEKLNVLINVPEHTKINLVDSANMGRPQAESLLPLVTKTRDSSFSVIRAIQNINIQNARLRTVTSNYAPAVSLISAYGLTYPNNLFFPPADQAYSIGFVGMRIQYNISSLYHNKNKVKSARHRLQQLQFLKQNTADNSNQEAMALFTKYKEALNRIEMARQSIEQARANLKIVSAKYFNQLALLTDLLDADDLFQGSKFDLVQAQVTAHFIYYRLLFTSGNLQ